MFEYEKMYNCNKDTHVEITDDKVGLHIIAIGSDKDDVSVTLKGNILNIKCKQKIGSNEKDLDYSYKVSDSIDQKSVKPSLKKGVLTVELSFKKENFKEFEVN